MFSWSDPGRHPVLGFIKSSRIGAPILLAIAAGAGLLYLVFRDPVFLYGVACYFAVVGGILAVSFVARRRRGKFSSTRGR